LLYQLGGMNRWLTAWNIGIASAAAQCAASAG
jgi:hypothetical protein